MNAADPIVAYIDFTDGQRRPVFEDHVGQYVVLDDGEVLRGVWYIPRDLPDEPIVVDRG